MIRNDYFLYKILSKFGIPLSAYPSPVRFFISLDALNQGSYQYLSGEQGTKEFRKYANRLNIFDFVNEYLCFCPAHEIMIPDRILPKHIKAMEVMTEADKQQIISRLRECNIITKDQDGKERINGILVDEFIHTEDHITAELLNRCHQSKQSGLSDNFYCIV